ncbi:MAG: outer rane efflux protein, partial [Bacteroidetes bacterium]|nr:outer rane efflux protein [Bacteroidota bacterium]
YPFRFTKLILLGVSILSLSGKADTLSLEQCQALAKQNYPLAKQHQLILKSKEYSLSNISKGYLPQVSLNGSATYQSDVLQLPIKIPGVQVPEIARDQYKIYGEINQPLSDLTVIRHHKTLVEANSAVQEQSLEVELYKLRERTNQIYFGILLLNEQIVQVSLLNKDIQAGLDKISSAVANGIALKSNADVLKAELLKSEQRIIELKAAKKSYLEVLGQFINKSLDESTSLKMPETINTSSTVNRPELILFDHQKRVLESQEKLITAKNLPRLALFLQSGYGRPAFNMFSNDFDFYYIGGLRLNWSLSNLYTMKKERGLISVNRNLTDIQKETFLFNISQQLKQQNSETEKLQELMLKDKEIIVLRSSIKTAAKAQLENGTITASDYLREVTAEDQAREALSFHKIQLLMVSYNQKTISGN